MTFQHNPGNAPMKVAFMFSGGASSLDAALRDPNHGRLYQVVGTVTNRSEKKAAKGYRISREAGMDPVFINPWRFKCDSDKESRAEFYECVTEFLNDMGPDVVGLSGWLKKYSIIEEPMLTEYRDRIINVHPARMGILFRDSACKEAVGRAGGNNRHPICIGRDGMERVNVEKSSRREAATLIERGWERLYVGDDAVTMAALFGETEVASVINVVNADMDGGALAARSRLVPLDQERIWSLLQRHAYDAVAEYAHKVQGMMKDECDGPVFCEALKLLSTGRMEIDGDIVRVDGEETPYGGYLMGDDE